MATERQCARERENKGGPCETGKKYTKAGLMMMMTAGNAKPMGEVQLSSTFLSVSISLAGYEKKKKRESGITNLHHDDESPTLFGRPSLRPSWQADLRE